MHDIIETQDIPKVEVNALMERVHTIVAAPVDASL
jgi:hypothetical protein